MSARPTSIMGVIALALVSQILLAAVGGTTEESVERYRRKGVGSIAKRWPNKVVPYELRSCFSENDKRNLYAAMADYHRYTCIRFTVARPNDKGKVRVQADSAGCFSFVGYRRRVHPVNLANGCRRKGTIIHELMHALGCFHEQSRPDRDRFVNILYNNIKKGFENNFAKQNKNVVPNWGVPYSYESVMHYSGSAFANKKGRKTIVAKKDKYNSSMGNRLGFAFEDIELLNKMYKCNDRCNKRKCPRGGFQGPDCRCWCKGPNIRDPVRYCNRKGGPAAGPRVPKDPKAPRSSCANGKK